MWSRSLMRWCLALGFSGLFFILSGCASRESRPIAWKDSMYDRVKAYVDFIFADKIGWKKGLSVHEIMVEGEGFVVKESKAFRGRFGAGDGVLRVPVEPGRRRFILAYEELKWDDGTKMGERGVWLTVEGVKGKVSSVIVETAMEAFAEVRTHRSVIVEKLDERELMQGKIFHPHDVEESRLRTPVHTTFLTYDARVENDLNYMPLKPIAKAYESRPLEGPESFSLHEPEKDRKRAVWLVVVAKGREYVVAEAWEGKKGE